MNCQDWTFREMCHEQEIEVGSLKYHLGTHQFTILTETLQPVSNIGAKKKQPQQLEDAIKSHSFQFELNSSHNNLLRGCMANHFI